MNEWEIEYSADVLVTHLPDLMKIINHINPSNDTELTELDLYRLRDVLIDTTVQIDYLRIATTTDTDPNPKKKFRLFKRK